MLQNIRDKAQGWVAYGIVILISVPFALWGIQEYMGVGSEPVAATVNGNEITERALDTQFQRFRQQLREQLGAAYRPELFDDNRVRTEVLDRMVRDELIQQVSHDMGLRVSDATVQAALLGMEAFQKEGKFDQQTFERAVRLQGLTPAGFMERVRRLLLSQQLAQAVEAGTFVTEYEKASSLRLMNQQREVSYFVVPADEYLLDGGVSDEQISTYYEDNETAFIVPERVKLDYLFLDVKRAGATVDVDDEVLRAYYEDNQEKFGLPEQRKASHILILAQKDAEASAVAEAKQKIEALAERIAQGEDFAELAMTHSQDPGSAAEGGDLGFFGKGVMDPAFEAAAFSLQKDQVSEPVRSSFGFHLIKVAEIKAGDVKPFEDARVEVEREHRKAEGERLYFEMAQQLADLSYEDPTSLEPAADALGLTIEHSDWVTRDKADGVIATPKVLAGAFNEDVLQEGNNSELIEIDGESSIVLRVVEHEEATTQPLSEVRDRIVEILRQQNAESQAETEAEKRKAEMLAGASLQQVAGAHEVTGPVTIGRNDRSVPFELNGAVFSSEKPNEGEIKPGVIRLANGDHAVYGLNAVNEGEVDDKGVDLQAQSLRRGLQRGLYEELLTDLESRADIEILLRQASE
ncbi:MAG: SurA N-terminal domain-containing protein [Candidatus Thiodiazotropha sp. (ex Myrtea spinifera)]|nr:SurA N-terminal domain-containing protein [Candidatus Thiodiazotropha sp. (ex Myrtea spinifera)]